MIVSRAGQREGKRDARAGERVIPDAPDRRPRRLKRNAIQHNKKEGTNEEQREEWRRPRSCC